MPSLPHGTEVLTRVERHSGERRLAPGTIGRVVRARDGGYDVHFVGVGELWFAADELDTRKTGQRAFAERRDAAWAALRPCVVLEAVVGSRAWGLAGEGSDTDSRGAFALPLSWASGLVDAPTDLVSADGSHTFWELTKTVRQALRADPNTLELLFVPSVRATDELGAWLLEARDAFVSRAIFGSFGRYALSQLGKLEQAHRLSEHRDLVLDWLRTDEELTLDACAERLQQLSGRDDAKTYLKQLYRSLSDQGLIASNDFDALKTYARAGGRRPPEARELRPKNAYNLLRLIALATGWLRDGAPTFAATGAFRDRLLAIKSGAVPLADVLAEAEAMTPALEAARDASRLPQEPDYERANALVRRAQLELARRWVHQVAGPFGQHAPPAPSWSPDAD